MPSQQACAARLLPLLCKTVKWSLWLWLTLHSVSQSQLISSYSSGLLPPSPLTAFISRHAVWSHFSPAQGNHFQSEWEFLSPGVVRGQVLDKADITACDSKHSAIANPQTGEPRASRLFQDRGKRRTWEMSCGQGWICGRSASPHQVYWGKERVPYVRANGANGQFHQWTNRLEGLLSAIAWLSLYKARASTANGSWSECGLM